MGISKKYLSENFVPVHFDPEQLASALEEQFPEVDFCFLMGSAVSGTVEAYSDLDLAFYLNTKPSYEFYGKAMDAVRSMVPDVRCDVGVLNSAEPVYRFAGGKLRGWNPLHYHADYHRTSGNARRTRWSIRAHRP